MRIFTSVFLPPRQLFENTLFLKSEAFPTIHLIQFLFIMHYLSVQISNTTPIFSILNQDNLCAIHKQDKVSTSVGNCF